MGAVKVDFKLTIVEEGALPVAEYFLSENDYDVRGESQFNGPGGRTHVFPLGSMDTANIVVVRALVNGGTLYLDGEVAGHRLNPWGIFIGCDCEFTAVKFVHAMTAIVKEFQWGWLAGTDIIVDNLDNPVVDNLNVQVVK
jgi:hypothetical protein